MFIFSGKKYSYIGLVNHDANFCKNIYIAHTHTYTSTQTEKNMYQNINHVYFCCQVTGDFYSSSSFYRGCAYVSVCVCMIHTLAYFHVLDILLHLRYIAYEYAYLHMSILTCVNIIYYTLYILLWTS